MQSIRMSLEDIFLQLTTEETSAEEHDPTQNGDEAGEAE